MSAWQVWLLLYAACGSALGVVALHFTPPDQAREEMGLKEGEAVSFAACFFAAVVMCLTWPLAFTRINR